MMKVLYKFALFNLLLGGGRGDSEFEFRYLFFFQPIFIRADDKKKMCQAKETGEDVVRVIEAGTSWNLIYICILPNAEIIYIVLYMTIFSVYDFFCFLFLILEDKNENHQDYALIW